MNHTGARPIRAAAIAMVLRPSDDVRGQLAAAPWKLFSIRDPIATIMASLEATVATPPSINQTLRLIVDRILRSRLDRAETGPG